MKIILNCLVRSIPLSVVIISVGFLIVYLFFNYPESLDVTLFSLGAIPIVIFLPSVFSQSKSGALHTPKVIFRKVNTLDQKEKKEKESIIPALSYVFAGILTWIISFLIY